MFTENLCVLTSSIVVGISREFDTFCIFSQKPIKFGIIGKRMKKETQWRLFHLNTLKYGGVTLISRSRNGNIHSVNFRSASNRSIINSKPIVFGIQGKGMKKEIHWTLFQLNMLMYSEVMLISRSLKLRLLCWCRNGNWNVH